MSLLLICILHCIALGLIIIIMKIVHTVHIQAERQTNRQIENEYKITEQPAF